MLKFLQILHLSLLVIISIILSLQILEIIGQDALLVPVYKIISLGVILSMITFVFRIIGTQETSTAFLIRFYRKLMLSKAALILFNLAFILLITFAITMSTRYREVIFLSKRDSVLNFYTNDSPTPYETCAINKGMNRVRVKTGILYYGFPDNSTSQEKEIMHLTEIHSIWKQWDLEPIPLQ